MLPCMRVISGVAKGHRLKGPPDNGTRPMIDRVKESLFGILTGYGVIEGRVLDLFAGTGSIGIECLSRGAQWVDFVEQRAAVCRVIKDNLAHTKFSDRARIHQMAVEAFIAQARDEPYAIIVMDPPYASATIETTLNAVAHSRLVRDGTIVVLGHWPRLTPKEQYGHLTQLTSRRLGDSSFTIFENINEDVTKDE